MRLESFLSRGLALLLNIISAASCQPVIKKEINDSMLYTTSLKHKPVNSSAIHLHQGLSRLHTRASENTLAQFHQRKPGARSAVVDLRKLRENRFALHRLKSHHRAMSLCHYVTPHVFVFQPRLIYKQHKVNRLINSCHCCSWSRFCWAPIPPPHVLLLDQRCLGATLEPIFLAEIQFSVNMLSRAGPSTELSLELPQWKGVT